MAKYKMPISSFLRGKEQDLRAAKTVKAKKFQETADRIMRGWDEPPIPSSSRKFG